MGEGLFTGVWETPKKSKHTRDILSSVSFFVLGEDGERRYSREEEETKLGILLVLLAYS